LSAKTTRKVSSITWRINDDGDGHEVRSYFAVGDSDVYCAGNHPGISDAWMPTSDPRAPDCRTLRLFAQQTALERAVSLGVLGSPGSEER
jgi:hypothetical protein